MHIVLHTFTLNGDMTGTNGQFDTDQLSINREGTYFVKRVYTVS